MKNSTLIAPDGKDVSEDLAYFINVFGLDAVMSGRYSMLLGLQLYIGFKAKILNPWKVIDEIKSLEGMQPSRLKPSTPFKGKYLKGLYHKHYLEYGLRAVAKNLRKNLRKDITHWFQKHNQDFSVEDVPSFVRDFVYGRWENLIRRQKLTGEWIIYAEHEGKNYYLCLGKHGDDDKNIRKQIDALCCLEFPFLNTLLNDLNQPVLDCS